MSRIATRGIGLFVILLAVGADIGAKGDTLALSLRELLIEYRCPVVDRLDQIYQYPSPTDYRDRFIAVAVPEHPHGYVQCMFIDKRTRMLCEASSGYYFDKPNMPRTFRLPAEAIASLARLGFSTDDSAGNFSFIFAVANPPDLNAIADLILTALHDAYGARASSRLRFNAPFAPQPTSKCVPVS